MDTDSGNENTPQEPDVGFWQGLFDSVKGWFDNLGKSIGDNFTATLGKITDIKDSISDWFSKVFDSITLFFKDVGDWFKNFPTMIGDLFDKWFNPNSKQLSSDYSISNLIEQRLTFVQQFKNAISNLSTVGQPLQLPVVKLGTWEININAKWFEPHVPKIRASLSTLFWVLCALCCWRTISSAFGVGVNTAPGLAINSSEKVEDTEIPGQYRFKF